MVPRYALFTPRGTRNGPTNPDRLKEMRRTTCYLPIGEQTLLEDNWKVDGHRPLAIQWTGTTEFEENVEEPMEPPTTYGRVPQALQLPVEPTPQERELHNLTHLPFQSWCTICVKAKGRADHHRKKTIRMPIVQVDYNFASTEQERKLTILTACDVITGLVMCIVVPFEGSKQLPRCSSQELSTRNWTYRSYSPRRY